MAQATTSSSTALVPNNPKAATDHPAAITARNKVEQHQLDCNPTASACLM